MFSVLLGIYVGAESLGPMVTLYLIFRGTAKAFSKAAAPCASPPARKKLPISPRPRQPLSGITVP